jgi:hypothetical protein
MGMYVMVVDARGRARQERTARAASIALVMAAMMATGTPAWAYQQGDIMRKAQPIIDLLRDVAEPIAYGCYLWAFIRYILGQRAEATRMAKDTTWGFIGIQILPWLFDIIKGIGQ